MNHKEKVKRQTGEMVTQPVQTAKRRPGRPTLSNEELLDKALDLFLEQGFERTSIDAITAAAGMAKRTVYLRYGDKQTLFKEALLRAIEDWMVPVEDLQALESEDLEETLLKIGSALVSNIISPAGLRLLRITNAESARMPEIGAYTYRHGTARTLAYLSQLFVRHSASHGVNLTEEDANEAAMAFLNLVVGGPASATAWGVVLDDRAIDHQTRYSIRLFLHGLFPLEQGGKALQADEDSPENEESQNPRDLETENRRLRKMLLEAMLENASLKEQVANP